MGRGTFLPMLWKLRAFWYRLDKAVLAFAMFFVLVVALLVAAAAAVFAQRDAQQAAVRESQARSLDCLARNIYYEPRGESRSGQYAVAEVTMNRKASRLFPRSVCEVVYQKTWDPIRKRQVAAFSWTEFGTMPEPRGEEWQRAQQVASAVYYNRYQPQLQGGLYFHATYIRPEWAKEKRRIARIGRHVFYR